jgi:hypothetical protein
LAIDGAHKVIDAIAEFDRVILAVVDVHRVIDTTSLLLGVK